MSRPTKENAAIAAKLREVAAEAERMEGTAVDAFFTCNEVARAFGEDEIYDRRERPVAHRYWNALGFEDGQEIELWDDPDCGSIRVLMLCFAAAMAETGDL